MKLQPDGVVVEHAARQPGPLDGVLAFLDVLFRRAALIVKGDDALSTAREVGHDKADARVQLTWMPLDLGDFELQTEGASTMDITTIGFDLAKTVFQVHGADGEGRVVLRRKLRRGKVLALFAGLPTCLVGMEACASAHYWARELQALGHEVRLIPPQYVRPFVKTNKNDAADAEAICEAVTRPMMRFAAAKSSEQQSVLMLHRARELLVRQRTMVINALRGHCAELGLIVAQGPSKVEELVAIIEDPDDGRLPPLAREALGMLVEQLRSAQARIKALEATLLAWHRSNQASRRLATIPGVGVITATALVATIGDGAQFGFGAWSRDGVIAHSPVG